MSNTALHTDQYTFEVADRYTRIAIAFHWIMAALILFNLGLGYFMNSFGPVVRGVIISLHISSGITVLLLTIGRVLWRISHKPPAYPRGMRPWEQHLAHLNHLLLYAAMVIMPLTGWAIISSHPPANSPGARLAAASQTVPTAPAAAASLTPQTRPGPDRPTVAPRRTVWGIIPLPLLSPVVEIGRTVGGVAPQKVLHEKFVNWHGVEGYFVILLLLLHVAGAIKHQIIDRRREFARMGLGAPGVITVK